MQAVSNILANICRQAAVSHDGFVQGTVAGAFVRATRKGARYSFPVSVEVTVNGVARLFEPRQGKWYQQ